MNSLDYKDKQVAPGPMWSCVGDRERTCGYMRLWYNGITFACRARNLGSIPSGRFLEKNHENQKN